MTPHQLKLCRLRLDGLDLGEIAEIQKVTVKAIEYHFTKIYKQLGVRNAIGFVIAFQKYEKERKPRAGAA